MTNLHRRFLRPTSLCATRAVSESRAWIVPGDLAAKPLDNGRHPADESVRELPEHGNHAIQVVQCVLSSLRADVAPSDSSAQRHTRFAGAASCRVNVRANVASLRMVRLGDVESDAVRGAHELICERAIALAMRSTSGRRW